MARLIAEMVRRFGGIQSLAEIWFSHFNDCAAGSRQRGSMLLAILRLWRVAHPAPDNFSMSDEERMDFDASHHPAAV